MNLTVLLVPSRAAAVEIPRRLAAGGRAIAGLLPMKLLDLVDALAEPALLGRGLQVWNGGHAALLAARILDEVPGDVLAAEMPRTPIARVLSRTASELRLAGTPPAALAALSTGADADDAARLSWLARLYARYHEALEGRFADPATRVRAATEAIGRSSWLRGAEILVGADLEPSPLEVLFLAELARRLPVGRLERTMPPSLRAGSFAAWADGNGIVPREPANTLVASAFPTAYPHGLAQLQARLFEPPAGGVAADASVELLTAPGEAAEVRAIVRRILRDAGAIPFDEMAVLLPKPEEYARLFTDLLTRLGIPHRLHPSLPLRFGRAARSLLLLLRCRGLRRHEVMEFVTFAAIPFADLLGAEVVPRPAQWDLLSRQAGIVSGLERWRAGTEAIAREDEEAAARETDPERSERRRRRADDARALARLVTALDATLSELAGVATFREWSERLLRAFDAWISAPPWESAEYEAVRAVLQELAALDIVSSRAGWTEVLTVLESRLSWERQPLEPLASGGVHVGALDALAGVPFRWVAIAGLVEGGFPGVLRPDPLLLDAERERLAQIAAVPPSSPPSPRGQLSLFDEPAAGPAVAEPSAAGGRLLTTQDRLLAARRAFAAAVGQATERLVLAYPRADARSGRERLPSLFFVAAATALAGRPAGTQALAEMVVEDSARELAIEEALDPSERDRARVREGGLVAVRAIAAGSRFFRQSHLASQARWSNTFTPYDGLVAGGAVTPEIAARLDPVTAPRPVSASGLALFAQCGFKYLLEYVLGLDPAPEPEERTRLDPLERGSLFHDVAERFLRERRDQGRLPLRDTDEERERLRAIADERLSAFIAGTPPRFTVLWERECARFHATALAWLAREVRNQDSLPLHFEVGFGLRRDTATGEPRLAEPLTVDLGDGRTLRVAGKIDRIDRRPGAGLVVRDYKTGRTPTQPGVFRGGRQLQIPFYVLAVRRLFPDERVAAAFLDFVDEGQRIAFDPDAVTGDAFRATLRAVVGAIAQGRFAQEPAACEWCDFKRVCGPAALIERRRSDKVSDRRLQQYLRLRDLA